MIKTDFDVIDSIRELLNVSDVLQYVDEVRPFENQPSDYSNKKKFIVISFLSGNADDLQRGVVNINFFAPDDNASNTDITAFKNVEPVLINILTDAYYNDMEIDLAITPKVMKDIEVDGYHFMNIRINFYNPSII